MDFIFAHVSPNTLSHFLEGPTSFAVASAVMYVTLAGCFNQLRPNDWNRAEFSSRSVAHLRYHQTAQETPVRWTGKD